MEQAGARGKMPGMELAIPVGGGEVWAEDTGDGRPLVLMHPGWGDAAIWDPILGRLAARYRVIRYDARGYGRSPASAAPYTHLADLAAVLDHFGVPHAALVAHSGAGGPAVGLALAKPERVSALVLVAPGFQDYPWPQDDPYFQEFEELYTAGDRDGLVALGLRTWAVAGGDPAAQAQIRRGRRLPAAWRSPGARAARLSEARRDQGPVRGRDRRSRLPHGARLRRADRRGHPRLPLDRRARSRPPAPAADPGRAG